MAEQVVADDFQRHQAELGIEHRHRRALPVIGGDEPDALAVVLQAQLEHCSQQRRITHRQAQSVTEGGTGEQRITEHAVAGNVHPPAQLQADVTLERNRVGADLHLLIGGDARVRPAQVRRTDATAGEQRFAGQAFGLEGVEHQRHGVEGGEVGVEHGRYPALGGLHYGASCMPGCAGCTAARNAQAKKGPKHALRPLKGERCLVPRPGERCYSVSVRPSAAPDAEQSCFPGAGCRRAFLRRASLLRAPVPARRGRFQGRYGRCGWRFHSRCTGSAR